MGIPNNVRKERIRQKLETALCAATDDFLDGLLSGEVPSKDVEREFAASLVAAIVRVGGEAVGCQDGTHETSCLVEDHCMRINLAEDYNEKKTQKHVESHSEPD